MSTTTAPSGVSDAQKVAYWLLDTIAAADDTVTIAPSDHGRLTLTLPDGRAFSVQVDAIEDED
ncbi:hypothetical protein [Nocardia sp. NPDC051833]|uniref:hypothetical protein n=1 Tax=Nocardia sp. NPDC051833 TaxID=3155674 RepID=UPI00344575BC